MTDDIGMDDWDYETNEPRQKEPTTIDDLDFNVRTYNCLKREGITTIQQLVEKTENDLLDFRNFTLKSITEVKEKLAKIGKHLAGPQISEDLIDVEIIKDYRFRGWVLLTLYDDGRIKLAKDELVLDEGAALYAILKMIYGDQEVGHAGEYT